MKYIAYIALTIAAIFFVALLEGWAVSVLWNWFIATTFGLPVLTIPIAIGVSLVVTVFQTPHTYDGDSNKWRSIGLILRPIFAVLFGYILKTFFL